MSFAVSKISLRPLGIGSNIHVRHYAKKQIPPKKRTAMEKKSPGENNQAFDKGGPKPPIFQPLPASSLTDQVFQPRSPELNLPPFSPEGVSTLSIGTVMVLKEPPGTFGAFGLPRNILLDFKLLSKPCSVVRETTLRIMNSLDRAKEGSSQNSRLVLTGDPGCGKSFLLVQAVNYALQSGWLVLYIPRTIPLLNSTTPYQYDPRTQTYQQPAASQQILRRFLTVNSEIVKSLKITQPINIARLSHFGEGTPLAHLIDAGKNDPHISSDVLTATLEQLGQQKDHPVLLAVDDFQALYCKSEYRDPDFNRIQGFHLSVPRLLLEYAGGLKSFNKGAILGAMSTTNVTYPAPLEVQEALQLIKEGSVSPYERRSSALIQYTQGLNLFPVPSRLSISEALGVFGLWSSHLALHTKPEDELFHSKYTESSANARQFVRGLLGTLET